MQTQRVVIVCIFTNDTPSTFTTLLSPAKFLPIGFVYIYIYAYIIIQNLHCTVLSYRFMARIYFPVSSSVSLPPSSLRGHVAAMSKFQEIGKTVSCHVLFLFVQEKTHTRTYKSTCLFSCVEFFFSCLYIYVIYLYTIHEGKKEQLRVFCLNSFFNGFIPITVCRRKMNFLLVRYTSFDKRKQYISTFRKKIML